VPQDLKELIPRTRRAIEGPAGAPAASLDDDQVLGLIADAVADVIFYTGGLFGHQLLVTDREDTYNAPKAWSVEPALEPDEETVVIATAALAHFFHAFRDLKVQEEIANEGARWSYSLSANLVLEQMKLLRTARDTALEQVAASNPIPTVFINLLEQRDLATARAIEPYAVGGLG
jgi:hypothetical protein